MSDFNFNPIAGVIQAVGGVVSDLVTTDKERLAAEIELGKLGQAIDLGQIEVNKVEAASSSVFVAGWRPSIGWVGATALGYQFVLYPLLIWGWALAQAQGWIPSAFKPPPMLDTDALWVILSGLLGLAGLRTTEKIKSVAR